MAQVKPLSAELQKFANEEWGEVPSKIPEALLALKSWIRQQPHLKARTDDQFLIQFLRICKYDLRAAKNKVDYFFALKTMFPDFFGATNIDSPKFREIHNIGCAAVLPNPLNGCGPRILVFRFLYSTDKYRMEEIIQVCCAVNEVFIMNDPYACLYGVTYILDMAQITTNHVLQYTPMLVKKIVMFYEKFVPFPVKSIHFVNVPVAAEPFFKLFSLYLSADLRQRRRRERGRIPVKGVRLVETATVNGEGGDPFAPDGYPFQVGYCESSDDQSQRTVPQYTLYLVANSEKERTDWIRAIRQVCEDTNTPKSYRFHPGLWSGKRWSCCKGISRATFGCQAATHWRETNNNPSTGSSPAQISQRSISPNNSTSTSQFSLHHNSSGSLGSSTPTSLHPQSSVSTFKQSPNLLNGNGSLLDNTMPGGIPTPGTPNSKAKDNSHFVKLVVALYPFKAIEGGDLSLEKNAEYEVIDDSQEHWWKVKDAMGNVGYIPSNYVKPKALLGLERYEWYVGDMSRQRAESLLKQGDKEGCFVVRKSSTKGLYTLSLHTKVPQSHVKHYHIKQNARGEYYLSEKHCCETIPDLINYHRHNSGGLACRLKSSPCDRPVPPTAGLSHDKWEIHPMELMLMEELGSGQFGVVRRGKWRGSIDTAVKMMKEGTMSEDDFIEEAKVMTKLQHPNLVQLYGVCSKHRPIYIVTEYMKHGSLLNYLRRHETTLIGNMGLLLDMCIQVSKGMAYLERHNYIHRDLAARNCLVGSENVVKVADFGLARYVLDDQYTSSGGTKFPIKWAPPEVLNYTRFSSKSDVWAYGVLMWEVFTCGKMPYGRLKNTEVVERVQRGIILEKPKSCAKEIYDVMKKCWSHSPEDRPSFRVLKEQLALVAQTLTD